MMRIRDIVKLAWNEFHYGRGEWFLSGFMQIVIMTCVLFTFTVALQTNRVGDEMFRPIYASEWGYYFQFDSFTEENRAELEQMGFHDIEFYNNGDGEAGGFGYIDSIQNIWFLKLRAVLEGKDIWDEDNEELFAILLLLQLVFWGIGIALMIMFVNSTSNAFAMKYQERERYIRMLRSLGFSKERVAAVYLLYFGSKVAAATVLAVILNTAWMNMINHCAREEMKITQQFKVFIPELLLIMIAGILVILLISSRRGLKEGHDEKR